MAETDYDSESQFEIFRIRYKLFNLTIPPNPVLFSFEDGHLTFLLDSIIIKYPYVSYVIGLTYVLSTFLIQNAMRNRDALSRMVYLAFVWNGCLALINAFAFCRLLLYAVPILNEFGLRVSICTDKRFMIDPVCSTWLTLFPFLKILELGDTFILVLQKRRLDPYFWCHHLFALLGSWYIYPWYPALSVWLCLIIYGSHVPVYIYSCLRSVNVTMPKIFTFLLMLVEISTVFIGAVLCSLIFYYETQSENNCYVPRSALVVLFVIFVLCFVLCNILLFRKLQAFARESSGCEEKK